MERARLSELKQGVVRCVIPYKDVEGNDKQIEVYNIVGDRRAQILDRLAEIADAEEGQMEYTINSYYMDLISEFTDLKIEAEDDIIEMLNNPSLAMLILKNELDEMVYELQIERFYNNATINRAAILTINRSLVLAQLNEQIKKENDAMDRFIKSSDDMIKNVFGENQGD